VADLLSEQSMLGGFLSALGDDVMDRDKEHQSHMMYVFPLQYLSVELGLE
jgi:hypothetical protein